MSKRSFTETSTLHECKRQKEECPPLMDVILSCPSLFTYFAIWDIANVAHTSKNTLKNMRKYLSKTIQLWLNRKKWVTPPTSTIYLPIINGEIRATLTDTDPNYVLTLRLRALKLISLELCLSICVDLAHHRKLDFFKGLGIGIEIEALKHLSQRNLFVYNNHSIDGLPLWTQTPYPVGYLIKVVDSVSFASESSWIDFVVQLLEFSSRLMKPDHVGYYFPFILYVSGKCSLTINRVHSWIQENYRGGLSFVQTFDLVKTFNAKSYEPSSGNYVLLLCMATQGKMKKSWLISRAIFLSRWNEPYFVIAFQIEGMSEVLTSIENPEAKTRKFLELARCISIKNINLYCREPFYVYPKTIEENIVALARSFYNDERIEPKFKREFIARMWDEERAPLEFLTLPPKVVPKPFTPRQLDEQIIEETYREMWETANKQ